jgi:hypothetical protein
VSEENIAATFNRGRKMERVWSFETVCRTYTGGPIHNLARQRHNLADDDREVIVKGSQQSRIPIPNRFHTAFEAG